MSSKRIREEKTSDSKIQTQASKYDISPKKTPKLQPKWKVEVEMNIGWQELTVRAPFAGEALDAAINALWALPETYFILSTRPPVLVESLETRW